MAGAVAAQEVALASGTAWGWISSVTALGGDQQVAKCLAANGIPRIQGMENQTQKESQLKHVEIRTAIIVECPEEYN